MAGARTRRSSLPVAWKHGLAALGLTAAGGACLHLFAGAGGWVAAFLAVNVVTAAFYAWDKLQSRRQGPRVPESTLHLLALAGGTPAAFACQHAFRHKTRKRSFRIAFWCIAALQAAALAWWRFGDR